MSYLFQVPFVVAQFYLVHCVDITQTKRTPKVSPFNLQFIHHRIDLVTIFLASFKKNRRKKKRGGGKRRGGGRRGRKKEKRRMIRRKKRRKKKKRKKRREDKEEEEEEERYSLYVLRVGWIGGSREGKGGKEEEEEPKGFGRKVYPRDQYIEGLKKESLKHKRRVKIGDKKIRRVRRGREQRDKESKILGEHNFHK